MLKSIEELTDKYLTDLTSNKYSIEKIKDLRSAFKSTDLGSNHKKAITKAIKLFNNLK